MATTTELTKTQKSLFDIPLNVGLQGGDLPARYYSTGVILALSIMAAPPVHLSPSALKISALLASMSGTMLLMAGLVFSQKTHYAGVLLIPVPFTLLWLAGAGLAWLGVFLGLVFAGWGVQNLVTKRCAVNKLLGVNSCS
ncbi:hypothetical protein L0337_41485 [candidate division KSB1 bacterium]|nr:hypothetical protein [candidate division KSB1 bacterium]